MAIVGFLCAGGAIVSAAYSTYLAPRSVLLREKLTLFRNLQVGIVTVDNNDWVIEANDRAEELFGRKLPKLGVTALPGDFQELIATRLRENEVEDEGNGNRRFRKLGAEDIRSERVQGVSSGYYALLTNTLHPRWIRVLATPVMVPVFESRQRAKLTFVRVFATILEVDPETENLLNACLREKAQTATA